MDKVLYSKGIKEELDFPKKTLFGKFAPEKLEARRYKLEVYLNRLSQLINFTNYLEACEFFEIAEQTRVLLSSLEFEIRTDDFSFSTHRHSEDDLCSVLQSRKEGVCVHDFLVKLNHNPLMVAKAVKDFEACYFGRSLCLLELEIKCLLLGTNKLSGLLYFCGEDSSFVASNSCIQLFAKFLKFEYNSVEADKFLKVFAQTEPKYIREMHLGVHRDGVTAMDNSELVILYYYLEKNVYGIKDPGKLLNDPKTVNEYQKWIHNKFPFGYLFKKPNSTSLPKASIENAEAKDITKDDKILALMKSSINNLQLTEDICASSKSAAMPFINDLKAQTDDYKEWNELTSSCEDKIRIYTKGKSELRLEVDLKTNNPHKARECIFDVEKLSKWSSVKHRVLETKEEEDIVQLLHTNPTEKTQYVEHVKHRSKQTLGDVLLISEYSLILPASKSPEITRVHLNGSVSTLTVKADSNGTEHVEWKKLISLKEGYTFSIEYLSYVRKKLGMVVLRLNKMLNK